MAYVSEIQNSGHRGLKDRIASIRQAFITARQQRRVYDQTLRELRALNDRELADLGISAAQIPFIAREAAQMAGK